MLIITPVRGVVQDPTIIEQEAWSYAEAFGKPDLPKGLQLLWPRSAWRLEG